MINNIRFELSFKNISQLKEKLEFCTSNNIKNINIPCKGLIKKEFYYKTFEYIKKYYEKLDVVYHYSLYHQYSKNKEFSYLEFLSFIKSLNTKQNDTLLLISGSKKKKGFDVINVLNSLKYEKKLKSNIGIAFNPYLEKYFDVIGEKNRYEKKISSSLVESVWLQFGTDIKLLEKELKFIKNEKNKELRFFGSLLIPSKQFIARFKYRPWNGVYISDNYLSSFENFNCFTKDLINFYLENNITPVIETEVSSSKKLNDIFTLFEL